MALFNFGKKKATLQPQLSEERIIPKKDIISVQTFTQAKSFRGFRRINISTYMLDGVEKNLAYFRERGFDFANSAVQVMVVKAKNDEGKCLRIVIDGKFIGNVYKNSSNSEAFEMAVAKKLDKVHVLIEDVILDDGKYYGTETYILLHWPNIGPKVKVSVE